MARVSQQSQTGSGREHPDRQQAEQQKPADQTQRQAGNSTIGSTQQGGSETPTRFSDWASI